MKKFIVLILIATCIFTLSSCSLLEGEKDYEAEEKVFEFHDLKITLTESFEVDEEGDDTVWYESSDETSVSIDLYSDIGEVDLDLFVEELRKESAYKKVSNIKNDNGLTYIECEVESLGFEFLYLIAFYGDGDDMYMVFFMCDIEDYDTYEEHFIKWAKSVEIK